MKTLGNTISNSLASITLTNGTSFVTITAPPTGIYIISLPPNLGTPGQFLQTNGAGQTSWQTLLPGTGTVTSVNATTPAFLDVTITNPTSNANLAFTLSGTALQTTSGGTGLTTVGTSGQVLTSNGTSLVWSTPLPPGTGTVTSVAASVPTFLTVTGSPITSSGTLAITYSGTALPTTSGGTGLTTVGTNGQVLTSNGATLSWVTPYITSVNAAELTVTLGTLSLSTALATTISNAFATANTALATAGAASTAAAAAQTTANSAFALATTANALAVAAGADITTLGNKTISMNVPSFLSVSGSPVTLSSNGGFSVSYSGSALPTANGGTGLTTVGTNGQVLTSNGTSLVWSTPLPGTVTSVAASVPTFLTVTGSPINSSGTLAILYSGSALPTANGGTGSTLASTGTGGVVLNTSPTLVTPNIGVASAASLTTAYGAATRSITVGSGGTTTLGQISISAPVAGQARYHLSNNGGVCEWSMGQANGTSHEFRISSIVAGSGTSRFSISDTGVVTIPGLTISTLVRTNAANELVSVPAGTNGQVLTLVSNLPTWTNPYTTGSFTTATSVTIGLPTSGLITLKLSFVMNTNLAELIISGNTLLNGTGTNLPALEACELFTSNAGINTSTFLGQLVLDPANNFGCYASIDIDLNSTRFNYVGWSVYTRSAIGTARGAISGYITNTALSITLTPTAGTTTGKWTLATY